MLVLSVGQLMSVCHKPVLYQNCRMDRACFYHRGFPPQSTCPALSCMQIQLPLQIMVLLYVELCCNSGLRKILQQPVDCCSLSSTLQPYLPTFNSSLSMVIITDGTLAVPRTCPTLGDRRFAVAGPHVWNSLPAAVRQITSYGQFRQHVKTHSFRT